MSISCTSAYGPQNTATKETKHIFWTYLSNTAESARNAGKGFILQGDLNSTLGPSIIPGDPNQKNENGKLFEEFLIQNKLTPVNSLSLCKGVITRTRLLVTGRQERSAIDFYVVCERVLAFVKEMVIDNDRKYIATNYMNVKKGGHATDSDHYTQILKVKLETCFDPPKRQELFNFKNTLCQQTFKEITQDTNDFHRCLDGNVSNARKYSRWRNVLESYCGKAYRKIRVRTKRLVNTGAEKFIDRRNHLRKLIENKPNDKVQEEIDMLDEKVSTILHDKAKSNAYRF